MNSPPYAGRIPYVSTRFSLGVEMNRPTRDRTAEPVSRDQTLRHAQGQGIMLFPVQLTTSRIGNLTGSSILCYMDDHTYIHYDSIGARDIFMGDGSSE